MIRMRKRGIVAGRLTFTMLISVSRYEKGGGQNVYDPLDMSSNPLLHLKLEWSNKIP